MTVTVQVTNAGGSMHRERRSVQRPKPKAEIWSSKYGVPLVEGRMGWSARVSKGVKRLGRRFMKTFGPDKALEGLKEPIPADILLARPIMTKLK